MSHIAHQVHVLEKQREEHPHFSLVVKDWQGQRHTDPEKYLLAMGQNPVLQAFLDPSHPTTERIENLIQREADLERGREPELSR